MRVTFLEEVVPPEPEWCKGLGLSSPVCKILVDLGFRAELDAAQNLLVVCSDHDGTRLFSITAGINAGDLASLLSYSSWTFDQGFDLGKVSTLNSVRRALGLPKVSCEEGN